MAACGPRRIECAAGVQRSLGAEVDTSRLGLWGTSYAGGHVLVIAAKEGANVSAVVSMVCPSCGRSRCWLAHLHPHHTFSAPLYVRLPVHACPVCTCIHLG